MYESVYLDAVDIMMHPINVQYFLSSNKKILMSNRNPVDRKAAEQFAPECKV